jgi:nucleoside-diphosphate-sugar epimerase
VENGVSGEIYNLAAREALSEMEWHRQIAKLMDWNGDIDVTEEFVPMEGFNPEQHLVLDTSKIRKQLNYKEIYSVQEGLSDTIQWELENISS